MTNETPGALTRTWSCVLFDLDGTITDSAPGIIHTLTRTLTELGRPIPADLLRWVGPPILDSFRDYAGMTEPESRVALEVYRRHYRSDGAFDSAVFPGVAGLLESLRAAGIPIAVATSKPESIAIRILEYFGLAGSFDVISGARDDETRSAKSEVIEDALARLTDLGIDLSQTVMVGDREHDVHGAAVHRIPTILVEWGYGSPAEAAGSIAVVHSADQLRTLLLG